MTNNYGYDAQIGYEDVPPGNAQGYVSGGAPAAHHHGAQPPSHDQYNDGSYYNGGYGAPAPQGYQNGGDVGAPEQASYQGYGRDEYGVPENGSGGYAPPPQSEHQGLQPRPRQAPPHHRDGYRQPHNQAYGGTAAAPTEYEYRNAGAAAQPAPHSQNAHERREPSHAVAPGQSQRSYTDVRRSLSTRLLAKARDFKECSIGAKLTHEQGIDVQTRLKEFEKLNANRFLLKHDLDGYRKAMEDRMHLLDVKCNYYRKMKEYSKYSSIIEESLRYYRASVNANHPQREKVLAYVKTLDEVLDNIKNPLRLHKTKGLEYLKDVAAELKRCHLNNTKRREMHHRRMKEKQELERREQERQKASQIEQEKVEERRRQALAESERKREQARVLAERAAAKAALAAQKATRDAQVKAGLANQKKAAALAKAKEEEAQRVAKKRRAQEAGLEPVPVGPTAKKANSGLGEAITVCNTPGSVMDSLPTPGKAAATATSPEAAAMVTAVQPRKNMLEFGPGVSRALKKLPPNADLGQPIAAFSRVMRAFSGWA